MKSNREYIEGHERDLNELKIKREILHKQIFDVDMEIEQVEKFIEELEEEN